LASENEIDVSFDQLLPPNPKESKKIFFQVLSPMKESYLRVAIVFCPPWAVNELLLYANKNKLIEEWAWVFSDLGSSDVSFQTQKTVRHNQAQRLHV
jgi:hypothetical protein